MDLNQTTWLGGDAVESAHPPSTSNSTSAVATSPIIALRTELGTRLSTGHAITSTELIRAADRAFGGTIGCGAYTTTDAYEALQVAINHLIASDPGWAPTGDHAAIGGHLQRLERLEALLPTQSVRSSEQESFQQFSTPPAYACLVAWAAGLRADDVVLEPSIGTGSIACFAIAAGVQLVVGNERSARRASLARLVPGVGTVSEANAEQLSALAEQLSIPAPSVVLMNPPFSATAGRLAGRDHFTAARHIEEAFRLLRPGGRLVAIVGDGMATTAPRYRAWWNTMAKQATIAANIRVDGSVYRRFGTTMTTRVVVIDRPALGDLPGGLADTVVGDADDLHAAAMLLSKVRAQRGKGVRRSVDVVARTIPAATQLPEIEAALPDAAARAVAVPTVAADSTFVPYRSTITVPGAHPHPAALVESAAMASVPAPQVAYQTAIPGETILAGALSDAQLDQVIRAGAAHERILPDGRRQGYFVGDGTGVGKGRIIAGVIRDHWARGQRRAVWISRNNKLLRDATRDWVDLGGRADDLIPLKRIRPGLPIPPRDGVLFCSYDTLKQGSGLIDSDDQVTATGRLGQVLRWLGEEWDGVVAFDESHLMGNAISLQGYRGVDDPSSRALVGVDLQQALPGARVLYVSATGATEVANLSYADRLGLWGEGTAFATVRHFIAAIQGAGIAAMEVVARDLKALGLYLARSLSFQGVGYERLVHPLTADQRAVYDRLAEAWQVVLRNVEAALDLTQARRNGSTVATVRSQFWGYQQRFFSQILTAMPMPSVIRAMEADLAAGRAVVVQLVNTNAAAQERALAKRIADSAGDDEELDLDRLDLTPREQLLGYVERLFPVARFERYTDDKGNERSRPVVDQDGNPVLDPDAMRMRNDLLDDLRAIEVPDGPLDQLLTAFGPEAVAEVTGRSRRIVSRRKARGGFAITMESRTEAMVAREIEEFQADRRRILVMSEAGGTGQSYHADRRAVNQRLRRHYVLQPGWRADQAIQGLGRTHRSNQVQPPEYILVTTDLSAQKRFISSIARRLDQLGALTKGQRQTGSSGLFSAADNLEGPLARDALTQLLRDLRRDADGLPVSRIEFEAQTGLALVKTTRDGQSIPVDVPIPQFLNRLLSVQTGLQNRIFQAFADRLDAITEQARRAGTLDMGVEALRADRVEVIEERDIHRDPRTGAVTRLLRLRTSHRFNPVTWRSAVAQMRDAEDLRYGRRAADDVAFLLDPVTGMTDPTTGRSVARYRAVSVLGSEVLDDRLEPISHETARTMWAASIASLPAYRVEERFWLTGALLPVWHCLPLEVGRVYRTTTQDGHALLGRQVDRLDLDGVLKALGARAGDPITAEAVVGALRDDRVVALANGWRLQPVRIAMERRFELLGRRGTDVDLTPYAAELDRLGVLRERRNWRWRYFLTTGTELEQRIAALIAHRPVVSLDERSNRAVASASAREA